MAEKKNKHKFETKTKKKKKGHFETKLLFIFFISKPKDILHLKQLVNLFNILIIIMFYPYNFI